MKIKNLIAVGALLLGSTSVSAQDLADGYLRYNTDGTNATITGFVANQEVADLVIPAEVQDPVTSTKKYKVTAIGAKAFQGKTIIKTVTIADTNVDYIAGGAFAGCTNLETVTIGKKVSNIGNLVSPGHADINYTAESAAAYNETLGGAIHTGLTYDTTTDPLLATIETAIGEVLAGGIPTQAQANAYNATLAGKKTTADVEFPAEAAVYLGAFAGCSKLTTVNFNTPAATDFQWIDAGTFEGTGIVTLDLTNSHVQQVNQWFETLNTTLTTVKLPASLTAINAYAFNQLAALTTVDFTACTVNDFSINDHAFNGVPQIKTLELPAKFANLADGALAGSNIQSLTITSNAGAGAPTIGDQSGATKLTTLVVKGEFKGVITGPFVTLTSVTFEGKVNAGALKGGVFAQCADLASVTFGGELVSGAVETGAFGTSATVYAGKTAFAASETQLAINYSPTVASPAADAFAQDAFGTAAMDATPLKYAKLSTTTAYKAALGAIYCLDVDAAEATYALKVASNGSSKYYYAKLYSTTTPYKIAKKQGDATVVVYGAYVDASDATIYMENLQIINGAYWVPANAAVIVKSTANADVVMTNNGASNSIKKNNANAPTNEIYTLLADKTGLAQKDAVNPLVPYFLAPFADYGFLWSKFKDERVLKTGEYDPTTGETACDFLINCPVIPGAARIVWLDGSEDETTAIQTVKSVDVENDAIYNLAGQKVSASYKGVVIKNGKKMIQK